MAFINSTFRSLSCYCFSYFSLYKRHNGTFDWVKVNVMGVVPDKGQYKQMAWDLKPDHDYQFRVDVQTDINTKHMFAADGVATRWVHVPCAGEQWFSGMF